MLFVDDDEDLRAVMRILLDEEGYEFHGAGSIADASELLRTTTPDVLVLDMVLGFGSGTTILDELATRPDPPVTVLISGLVDLIPIAMLYGNLPIVPKPFEIEHLMAAIDMAIDKNRRPRRVARA